MPDDTKRWTIEIDKARRETEIRREVLAVGVALAEDIVVIGSGLLLVSHMF